MGGRGAGSGQGRGGGGGGNVTILSTQSLVSMREGNGREVDQTLGVLRDVNDRYGVNIEDAVVATMGAGSEKVMAYYARNGNLGVNALFFDTAKMDSAYDDCIRDGFHPPRGDKTGIEASVAHEMGHRLADIAEQRAGLSSATSGFGDVMSDNIVNAAASRLGIQSSTLQRRVSGYAKHSASECVAEAFADVYCNGANASRESRAVVAELNRQFGL